MNSNLNSNKLKNLMMKYNLTNIIKVCIIIIVLFLIFQLFTSPSHNPSNTLLQQKQINNNSNSKTNNNNIISGYSKYPQTQSQAFLENNIIENFASDGNIFYGNNIILASPDQLPVYSKNKCIFKFNGIYRIEGLQIKLNTSNNTNTITDATLPYDKAYGTPLPIYIQYYDGDNNLKFIKTTTNTTSPPVFTATNNNLTITNLIDENNLAVYASTIIISIGTISNNIDNYNINENEKYNRYIKHFAFYGCTREMISYTEYNNLIIDNTDSNNFNILKNGLLNYTVDTITKTYKYIYTNTQDLNVYSITLQYNITPLTPQTALISYEPCNLNISYNNSIYPGNIFKLNTIYYIRIDPSNIDNVYIYIYFTQPVIANQITVSVSNNSNSKKIELLERLKTQSENTNIDIINNYKRTVNTLLNNSTSQDTQLNVCPSLDAIVTKQNQVQQLCDNLDYQDKISSEKIRLEKNKQYLLKLQEQQKEIDQLNNVLNTLDTKRLQRSKNSDVARVLQYQKQKNAASTIIDLANQRLESQDNNQLYLDVNINNIPKTTSLNPISTPAQVLSPS